MAEKGIFSIDIRIGSADFKEYSKTSSNAASRIFDFQHQRGTKVLSSAVGCAVLLLSAEVTHNTSSVLRIICGLIQEGSGHASIEHHLNGVHNR